MSLSLDNLKLTQSVSWLENILEMHDESKSTPSISNQENIIGGCKRDLQNQALHSWAKVLQKSGGSASRSMFTFYKWGLYKLCIATALQNHIISLSLDYISITITEWQLFKNAFAFTKISALILRLDTSNPGAWTEYKSTHVRWLLEFKKVWKCGPVKHEFPPLRSACEAHMVGRSWRALPTCSTVPKIK